MSIIKKRKATLVIVLFISLSIALSLVLSFLSAILTNIYGATLYETTTRYFITKSLSYETCRMVTNLGFLDVHVMKVPLDDPYISVSPVSSVNEYGLKETTTKLLSDSGAIAGINGDFFGTSGYYSIPLGIEIADGVITSAGTYANANSNESAGLFITEDGSPFIEYLKMQIQFFNNGKNSIEIASINKTVDAAYPVCFTRDVLTSTKDIDARLPNTVKIVVENNVITYISQKGETVEVPDNGYIILMNESTANANISSFSVGQTANLVVTPSFDLSKIETAIGGAGKLLQNGVIANDTGFVASGRHPRTAVGYTKDKKTLIMMVVDGRGRYVGATHAEMADLMLKYGAYDAMHLDGGGSSTMAVTPFGSDSLSVINTLSDGAQRRVINALGVFMNAPVGNISEIVVSTEKNVFLRGHSIELDIFGVDEYYNRIELDPTNISVYTPDNSGTYSNGFFTPNRVGEITINVSYNDIYSNRVSITSDSLSVINANTSEILLGIDGSFPLEFEGVSREGYDINLDASKLNYEVYPPELGVIENGVFKAKSAGQGWIRCYIGVDIDLVEKYIPLYVTLTTTLLEPLNGDASVTFSSYPESVSGLADYHKYGNTNVGMRLSYQFQKSLETQAAYATFDNPIIIPENSISLRLVVQGDNSGNWLRGRIVDANGTGYNIDFARTIDFNNWIFADAELPQNLQYPVTLERIYVVSLSQNEATSGTLYFDRLLRIYNANFGLPENIVPSSSEFKDGLNVNFYGSPSGEAYDVTVMGALGYVGAEPANYNQSKATAINSYKADSSGGLYFGSADLAKEAGIPIFSNTGKYNAVGIRGLYALQISSTAGGIFTTDKTQWGQIKAGLTASYSQFIVIQTDTYPARFQDSKEYELFHDLLVQVAKTGKKIFVVSSDFGTQNTINIKDGIRYINLGRLYVNNALNRDFSILRFRIEGNDIKYSLQKVFN